jgi:hypothetical protein
LTLYLEEQLLLFHPHFLLNHRLATYDFTHPKRYKRSLNDEWKARPISTGLKELDQEAKANTAIISTSYAERRH